MTTATAPPVEVLIVGAGPVGLTLALALARHGRAVRIIDRAPEASAFCRAIGVTPRTLEVWEQLGVVRDMIDAGLWLTGTRSVIDGEPRQDVINPPLGLPYAPLGVPQHATERVLALHLARLGTVIERGTALTRLETRPGGVRVGLARGAEAETSHEYRFVIGCDGAHSAVRQQLGIPFEGDSVPGSFMLGDVHIDWSVPYGMVYRSFRPNPGAVPDFLIAIPLPEAGRYRVSMRAPAAGTASGGTDHGIQSELQGPPLEALQASADALVPEKPRLTDLRWSSIFRIGLRLAACYRSGNAFIAGDAAHIHPPTGGQGMNTGIQDAHNLAWRLALVLAGAAPEALLDSYEAERRPIGAAVIASTLAASRRLGRETPEDTNRLADAQVLISYRDAGEVRDDAVGARGPVAGDRAPDVHGLACEGYGFPMRLFEHLGATEHTLLLRLKAGEAGELPLIEALLQELATPGAPPLRTLIVSPLGLPPRPPIRFLRDEANRFNAAYRSVVRAFLIRPDGHIAWRGPDWRHRGLGDYWRATFGPR